MSLGSRLANVFSPGHKTENNPQTNETPIAISQSQHHAESPSTPNIPPRAIPRSTVMEAEEEEDRRQPYINCMLAGGIGGTAGDMLMHSLDTVKTRQQGDPHVPPKYTSMSSTYSTIFRQEGLGRGLYSGVVPAFLGSFPGTIIFFGTYEWTKRHLLEYGVPPSLSYLASGFFADFAASFVYVPSEVLKTRLQLQGQYNNPFFQSGYNYRSTSHALRTIIRQEGAPALFYGYKATIFRDLPFSALQFAFYELEQDWARKYRESRDIGLILELATGASAGGMAGVITCPLDVVKTRIQTQIHPELNAHNSSAPTPAVPPGAAHNQAHPSVRIPSSGMGHATNLTSKRPISTSSPSTHTPKPGSVQLDTDSVLKGLKVIYKTEGLAGWFRGVGPRAVWTSVQSGTMLLCYQQLLKVFSDWNPPDSENDGPVIA